MTDKETVREQVKKKLNPKRPTTRHPRRPAHDTSHDDAR
jgi:hypothetical protein